MKNDIDVMLKNVRCETSKGGVPASRGGTGEGGL